MRSIIVRITALNNHTIPTARGVQEVLNDCDEPVSYIVEKVKPSKRKVCPDDCMNALYCTSCTRNTYLKLTDKYVPQKRNT